MVQCVSFGCSNSSNKKEIDQEGARKLQFFRFPKDARRKAKWVKAVRRLDPKTKQIWTPSEHSRLCSEHFSPEHINYTYSIPRLKDDAVPTIFSAHSRSLQLGFKRNDIGDTPETTSQASSTLSSCAIESRPKGSFKVPWSNNSRQFQNTMIPF